MCGWKLDRELAILAEGIKSAYDWRGSHLNQLDSPKTPAVRPILEDGPPHLGSVKVVNQAIYDYRPNPYLGGNLRPPLTSHKWDDPPSGPTFFEVQMPKHWAFSAYKQMKRWVTPPVFLASNLRKRLQLLRKKWFETSSSYHGKIWWFRDPARKHYGGGYEIRALETYFTVIPQWSFREGMIMK